MATDSLTIILEALRRAGKSVEADKIEKRYAELLEEANKIPTNLIIEIDMGTLFAHDFTKDGFHMEHTRSRVKVKFEVKPVTLPDESPVNSNEMLQRAKEVGCDMDQQQGDNAAAFLNSPAGKEASMALRDSGCRYIILPNEDGLWVDDSGGLRCVPVLLLLGGLWVSGLRCLGNGIFGSGDRLLVPCKP